jgi:SpoIID/LytB domain protein
MKAQAVAGRSEAVAKIQKGIVSGSFFDFFATAMCQAYPGKGRETAKTRQAVDATRGEILVCNSEPVDAVYSNCCGGVVATGQDLWDGEPEPYFFREVDRLDKNTPPDLSNWNAAYQWAATDVDVLCNPDQPGFPNYAKKYHHWEKEYSGAEFSRLADRMYGTGPVRDLVVQRRTPSGRVRKLQIVGENKTVTVHREMELREALGDLYSTFFSFVKEYDKGGRLSRLTIHGAGFGHGVGMCQMGAYMMALHGYNYRQILAHYYKDVKIRRLYR